MAAAEHVHAAGTGKMTKKPLLERAVRVAPTLTNRRRGSKSGCRQVFRVPLPSPIAWGTIRAITFDRKAGKAGVFRCMAGERDGVYTGCMQSLHQERCTCPHISFRAPRRIPGRPCRRFPRNPEYTAFSPDHRAMIRGRRREPRFPLRRFPFPLPARAIRRSCGTTVEWIERRIDPGASCLPHFVRPGGVRDTGSTQGVHGGWDHGKERE